MRWWIFTKYSYIIPAIAGDAKFVLQTKSANEPHLLANAIEGKTKIKFDVIISDTWSQSNNPDVKVVEASKLESKVFSGKLFKSGEDKIAAYLNANATNYVIIDSKQKTNVNILFINCGNLQTQVIINAPSNTKTTVSEFYVSNSADASQMATLHEINARKDAQVELNMFHNENNKTYVASVYKATAEDNAKLKFNAIYCGGIVTKARGSMDSNGIKSDIEVTELSFGVDDQTFDINTMMTNASPYSRTELTSGAILDGTSKCILKGFAKVADKTRGAFSKITERGVLLSKDAHIDALPDMSIDYSNEVKATHSASTSPINPEDLFYLTSRGIEEDKARKLFVTAFIAKYVSHMEDPFMRELAMSILLDKLETQKYGVITEITPRNIWMASKS